MRKLLSSADFKPTINSPLNPVMLILDLVEKIEIELWLKPDGIVFDEETLKRRQRVELDKGFLVWIISAEDFIITKLARPDRGIMDEQDVKSVLVRQAEKLDLKYLKKRARDAGVIELLEEITGS